MERPTTEELRELVPDNLILLGYRGSVAHNMYVPDTDPNSIDDIDLMGIYFAPMDYYIGIKNTKLTIEKFIGKWDVVSYEYIKFVKLLLKSNPNVLSLLWIKPEHYLSDGFAGQQLIKNRDLFMSRYLYGSFMGYANGQLKKVEKYSKEGYMGEKRAALVKKYGYDTKNASHCIRLLKMGIEFLNEGKLNVFRTEDVDQLLDIKLGKWSMEDVKAYAADLFEDAKAACDNSPLPEVPDYEKVNLLVKDTILNYIDFCRYNCVWSV